MSETFPLLRKVKASLDRDRGLSLGHLIAKSARYAAASVSAPMYLASCDSVGKRARTRGGRPVVENLGSIEIGDDVQLNSAFSPVRLATGARGSIVLGDGVSINFGANISAEEKITLGDRVSLGPYVEILDHDQDASTGKPEAIAIGDDVWLAARVKVTKGSRVGAGTIVTAGSVVRGELPPGVVAGGVPARVLRAREGFPQKQPDAPKTNGALLHIQPTPDFRGVLIADFSVQELESHLGKDDGLGPIVDATTAPFGQVVQALHGLKADADGVDFAVVWTRPEAVSKSFAARLAGEPATTESILAEVDAFADLVARSTESLRAVFVPTWTKPPYHRALGMLDLKEGGATRTLLAMNARLAEKLDARPNAFLLDADRWLAASPKSVSAKLWYMGKISFSSDVLAEAAKDVRAALRGIRGAAKKLIVLDLDDTLWGGIVGDQGWQNLRLGGHDPLGEAFVDFQRELKALARRGITLAVVSKNEESVAVEAIRSHPEMVLKMEDISAHRINWRDKAMNIVEIAKELNLGLQSVVFLDDNPIERARVREALPEVLVPEWPEDKMQYATALHGLRCFDVPRISQEDIERTKMYAQERERDAMKTEFASLDDWLAGLGIRVRFAKLDASNLPRTAQLLNKTNQMNLRTRRLTEGELMEWASAPGREVWAVHVSDKLGDAGLTGILGLEVESGVATISDYVLSCRVMGRKVEETVVWAAVQRAKSLGAKEVVAPFLATPKNKPCLTFWRASGFEEKVSGETFAWDMSRAYEKPAVITVEGIDG